MIINQKKANTNAEGDDNETAINHDSNEGRNESSEDEWDDDAGYTVFHGFESYFRDIDSKNGKDEQDYTGEEGKALLIERAKKRCGRTYILG